jgi:16S rRNA (cytidine1402-2'-O)-methyltransferase
MGTLYLVATPIGNLEDTSPRAVRILSTVRLIAAEDTRHTLKLLNHFGIRTPLTSYFEHNKLSKIEPILAALASGDVALVSDAGTPALNDPGYELVRQALQAGYPVSPVPGPCAPVAALVASGLPTESFLYLGYLPRKSSDRRRTLEKAREYPFTLIFLETPHRLEAALEDLLLVLGDRQVAVARELTKQHEEILRGSLQEAQAHFAAHPPRGEFTLVIAGKEIESSRWSEERLEGAIAAAQAVNQPPSRLASQLAAESGWSKQDIYQRLMEISKHRSENS